MSIFTFDEKRVYFSCLFSRVYFQGFTCLFLFVRVYSDLPRVYFNSALVYFARVYFVWSRVYFPSLFVSIFRISVSIRVYLSCLFSVSIFDSCLFFVVKNKRENTHLSRSECTLFDFVPIF